MYNLRPFPAPARKTTRRGLSFLYVVVMMVLLIAFVAFAVDIGRMRLARAELQTGADAAARAGASALPFPATQSPYSFSTNLAAVNKCLGDSIPLNQAQDIELGIWHTSSRTLSVLPSSRRAEANAVHVTTRRLVSRGNPVKLYFAPVLGIFNNDIETTSIAYIQGVSLRRFGIVGLDFINANGNMGTIDSYDPNFPYGGNNVRSNGATASNGDVDLINGDIHGDVRAGGSISMGPNGSITGWQAPLEEPLSFAPAVIPPGTPEKHPTGSTLTLPIVPTDTYWTKEADKLKTINFASPTGTVYLYVKGNLETSGVSTWGDPNAPSRLRIFMVDANSTIDIGGSAKVYAEIYAPLSKYVQHGGAALYGSLIAKSITFKGTSDIHYDESGLFGPAPGYKVKLVQ